MEVYIMFELIPFDRRVRSVAAFDPFRDFEDLERSFFDNSRAVSGFRTDVTDTGLNITPNGLTATRKPASAIRRPI